MKLRIEQFHCQHRGQVFQIQYLRDMMGKQGFTPYRDANGKTMDFATEYDAMRQINTMLDRNPGSEYIDQRK